MIQVATQFWIIPFVISASWSYAAAEEGLIPQIESSQQKNDVAGSFRQPRFILGVCNGVFNINNSYPKSTRSDHYVSQFIIFNFRLQQQLQKQQP